MPARFRPDHDGTHRQQFQRNKRIILATQSRCGICGRPVDKTIKYPDPMSACIDHIIPIAQGGHPSDMDNLQLAHRCCNASKADKLAEPKQKIPQSVSNRNLPLSLDWSSYRA